MKKLVLVIRAHEGGLRTNVSSANQSRGSKGWSAVQRNVPGNSVDTDKHYKNIGQGGSPKIFKEKAATTALNVLQLTFWLH